MSSEATQWERVEARDVKVGDRIAKTRNAEPHRVTNIPTIGATSRYINLEGAGRIRPRHETKLWRVVIDQRVPSSDEQIQDDLDAMDEAAAEAAAESRAEARAEAQAEEALERRERMDGAANPGRPETICECGTADGTTISDPVHGQLVVGAVRMTEQGPVHTMTTPDGGPWPAAWSCVVIRTAREGAANPGRQPTCEERLPEHLESRVEWFGELVKAYDGECSCGASEAAEHGEDCVLNEDSEYGPESLQESPLAVTDRYVRRVELSYGGPQDYLTVDYGTDGEAVESIRYHFLDWFDGASRLLEGEEFEAAEAYVDRLAPPPAELR